jgi:hypothetical protein
MYCPKRRFFGHVTTMSRRSGKEVDDGDGCGHEESNCHALADMQGVVGQSERQAGHERD